MTTPKYQAIQHAQKGKIELANEGGAVHVIAGEYNGAKGAASTFSPVEMYDVRLNAGGEAEFIFPKEYNTGVLVLEGDVLINEGEKAKANNYVQFANEDGVIKITATNNSILMLLSGEPLNEPVANYGPFVMNTVQEIQQAVDDFNNGKFGTLKDNE